MEERPALRLICIYIIFAQPEMGKGGNRPQKEKSVHFPAASGGVGTDRLLTKEIQPHHGRKFPKKATLGEKGIKKVTPYDQEKLVEEKQKNKSYERQYSSDMPVREGRDF